MTTVLDLTGLGVRHMSKEAVSYTRRISDIFQDNYSGMTCSLLIVNAPWIFSKGWQIIEGVGGVHAKNGDDCGGLLVHTRSPSCSRVRRKL